MPPRLAMMHGATMQLADERPHLKLRSRTGGAYLLPINMLDDARDFFESRDPASLLTGTDIFGAYVYIERGDVVSLIVLHAEALEALEADRAERQRRVLLHGESTF